MPLQSDITKDMEWFANTDVQLVFVIYEEDDTTPIVENMAGWSCAWMFKRLITDDDTDALIAKSGGSVFLGTDPDTNLPAWFVQIDDDDSVDLEFSGASKILSGVHELKRIDAGLETVLSYGKAKLRRPVHTS